MVMFFGDWKALGDVVKNHAHKVVVVARDDLGDWFFTYLVSVSCLENWGVMDLTVVILPCHGWDTMSDPTLQSLSRSNQCLIFVFRILGFVLISKIRNALYDS
jgi:hypothetical protein